MMLGSNLEASSFSSSPSQAEPVSAASTEHITSKNIQPKETVSEEFVRDPSNQAELFLPLDKMPVVPVGLDPSKCFCISTTQTTSNLRKLVCFSDAFRHLSQALRLFDSDGLQFQWT
eukprot:Sdes_comp23403_c0_seq1m21658